jgi:hypothetical protein
MGQAGSSQQPGQILHLVGEYGSPSKQLMWDEHIARHLQEAEFAGKSIEVDAINERELQIARDAELAHYLDGRYH